MLRPTSPESDELQEEEVRTLKPAEKEEGSQAQLDCTVVLIVMSE